MLEYADQVECIVGGPCGASQTDDSDDTTGRGEVRQPLQTRSEIG